MRKKIKKLLTLIIALIVLTLHSFFLSSCSIDPPEVQKVDLEKVVDSGEDSFISEILLNVYNPNSTDLVASVTSLEVFTISDDELTLFKENKANSIQFLKEKPYIGALSSPIDLELRGKTNSQVSLKITLKKSELLKNSLLFLLQQKIELLFRGSLIFHHWTGNHKINILEHYTLDLRSLLK